MIEESGIGFYESLRRASDSEKSLVALVHRLFTEARARKWQRFGPQHRKLDEMDKWCRPYGIHRDERCGRQNVIFELIEDQKPIFLEQGFQVDVLPRDSDDEGDIAAALTIQDLIDYEIDRGKIQTEKHRQLVDLMLRTGTGFGRIGWSPEVDRMRTESGKVIPIGGIVTDIINIKNVFVDPFATNLDDAGYIIVAHLVSLDALKERYGEKAAEVSAISPMVGTEHAGRFVPADQPGLAGRYGSEKGREFLERNGAFVIELWARRPVVSPARFMEAQSKEKRREEERAAEVAPEEGRVITVAGGILLNDMPNPYGHRRFPFFRAQNVDDFSDFFGISVPEVHAGNQAQLSWLDTHIRNYVRLAGSPYMVLPQDADVHFSTLSSSMLPVIRPRIGAMAQPIRFITPPPIPAQLLQLRELTIQAMKAAEGLDKIDVNVIRRRQQAAATLEVVKEIGESRIRAKVMNLNAAWKSWAEMAVSIIQEFSPIRRTVRIAGRRNGERVPVKLEIGPDMLKDVDIGKFDIRVEIAPAQSLSRAARRQQLIEIDTRGVLGAPDPFNWERRELLARASGLPEAVDLVRKQRLREEGEIERRIALKLAAARAEAAVGVGGGPSPVGGEPSPVGGEPSPVGGEPSPVGGEPSPVGGELTLQPTEQQAA